MGLDISVKVIVGFKVTYKEVQKEVVRYDEMTGKPTTKLVDQIECSHDEKILEDLDRFYFDCEEEERVEVWGKEIYSSPSNRNCDSDEDMFIEISPDALASKWIAMKALFPFQDVQIYCYPDISY
jgi:hypothetical protein